MKNRNLVLTIVVLLLCSSLSCTFLKGKLSKTSVKLPKIETFDPKAPLVSPGAEIVHQLAKLDPSLAVFASDIEAVERAVMKKAIDEGLDGQETKTKETNKKSPPPPPKGLISAFVPAKYEPNSAMGALMFDGEGTSASDRIYSASVIGALINGMKEIFSESHTSDQSTGAVKAKQTETKDGTTTTMGAELSFNDDGSSGFGLELKTESTKNGAKLVAQMAGKVDGFDCPNAEGQVPLTVKLRLGGESGGVGYTQDLTAFIRANVDDNADVTNVTIDLEQGTREVNKGKDFYVETAWTVQYSHAGGELSDFRQSNWRLNRYSQSATPDAATASASSGQDSALSLAMTVLAMAEHKWQNGGCVKIDAKSPGSVAVSSTTQIPVKVVHKFGGAEVPSKLEATLSGEASVDPKLIPRTAGTLTYVAPSATNKNATIKLQASSRRGRATLDLTATTGVQSYRVSGESNNVSFTGEICSLNKPFSIDATFPGGKAKTMFTPSSAAGGSTTVSGGGGGCVHSGGGDYTVKTKEDGSATLSWTTTDKIVCPGPVPFNNSRTVTFTLPLQPAPDLSCP